MYKRQVGLPALPPTTFSTGGNGWYNRQGKTKWASFYRVDADENLQRGLRLHPGDHALFLTELVMFKTDETFVLDADFDIDYNQRGSKGNFLIQLSGTYKWNPAKKEYEPVICP